MTIDEAIAHCLEVAEKNENDVEVYEVLAKNHENTYSKLTATKYATDCAQCAADHRQLAEWLTELKEAKRLLNAAVEDVEALAKAFAEDEPCGSFTLCSECPLCVREGCSCKVWRYKAKALKLIGGRTDEEP